MSNKENSIASANLASRVTTKLPQSLSTKSPLPFDSQGLQTALLGLHQKRNKAQSGYEDIITSLRQVIEQLLQRNEFLVQDRDIILKQNSQLRKKVESLGNIIEVKKRLGESMAVESAQIFEILVESGSVTGGMSKIEQSRDEDVEVDVSNILSQQQLIFNRNEFAISSNPLSYNVSQIDDNEISMSNIGRTQHIAQTRLQTPGLARENIFIQCNTRKVDGVIRAFYLSILQRKATAKNLVKLIEQLKNDITTIIYEPYPTNEFWTDMLCNFVKIIHEGHFETQLEVLEYIKCHRLIDTLIINCLKSRVEFLFSCRDPFEPPSIQELLGSLSNEFCLRMEVYDSQYIFFTKEVKEENLLLSERASLEISLNNKSENKYYVKEEEPTFIIYEREDYLQLSFFIVIENQMGLSQYQLNEQGLKNNQSFKYSDERERSVIEHDVEYEEGEDHLSNIANILNERDLNIDLQKSKKLTRNTGHRRYNDSSKKSPYVYQQPLSSSRFFLNRVSSKHSSLDDM